MVCHHTNMIVVMCILGRYGGGVWFRCYTDGDYGMCILWRHEGSVMGRYHIDGDYDMCLGKHDSIVS